MTCSGNVFQMRVPDTGKLHPVSKAIKNLTPLRYVIESETLSYNLWISPAGFSLLVIIYSALLIPDVRLTAGW